MDRLINWHKEPLARVTGSRGLDEFKVQAPGVVKQSGGGFRLFYTAVGSEKPFNDCQGYILSAISDNGIDFEPDPGIRVAPDPERRSCQDVGREDLEVLFVPGRPDGGRVGPAVRQG